ncbi:MAG TPA: DUF4118 domain-containing protein [Bryobacteraceae bacterium]|jgi:hypothetical protein|nr:DUF4118 domain-containing protein [Bryobacteraceae bacterium]
MFAAGSVAATVILTLLFKQYLGNSPELVFVPAVVFSSLFCGLGPGLTSALLSIVALIYYFEEPAYSFAIDSVRDILDIVVFSLVAVSINAINVARQRAEKILRGLLPVCAWCRKIRREDQWLSLEVYARMELNTALTHSICPDCRERMERTG